MIGGNIPGETKVASIAIYDHVESLQYTNAHLLAGCMLGLSFLLLVIVYASGSKQRKGVFMSIEMRLLMERGTFALEVDEGLPARGVSAIFGPSGSGKTTLLRAIAGLDRPKRGFLKVGEEIWQDEAVFLPPHLRAVGYVFQEPSLFEHLNVQANIAYGRQRVSESERKISVDQIIELLEIEPLLGRFSHELSGGEQQRVAIARALATSPRVLLMDEPLASLDHKRKREILPYLESLHRELAIPVLYVSHAKEEVMRLADYLVLLQEGCVEASGPVMEVSSRLSLSMARDADAQCVLEAKVAEHDELYGLAYLDFSGGRLSMANDSLALGSQVRLLIKASDISITLTRATNTSILNVLPAKVQEMAEEGGAQVLVQVKVGSALLLAKVTRKSSMALGLKPGQDVFVQIKSVALLS